MNITICSAAIVILLSSVFMMFLKDKNLFLKFMNTLDNKQKEIYDISCAWAIFLATLRN